MRRPNSPRIAAPTAIVALAAALCWARPAAAQTAVLAWPEAPPAADAGIPHGAALDAAVTAAGFRALPFNAVAQKMSAAADAERAAEQAVLDTVQAALAEARQAYLELRWEDMLRALEPLDDGAALAVLAAPAHTAVLWDIEFQLGLAHLSRGGPDDAAQVERRFGLAVSLDPERLPEKGLYGPDVGDAFGAALARRSAQIPRPVAIAATPSDAQIAVDGVAVVLGDKPRSLRPGLHAVHARAAGYARRGALVEVGAAPIEIELTAAAGDAATRIGPAWAAGALRADTSSGQAAIRAVLAQAGATAAVVVAPATDGVRARVITGRAVGEPVTAATADQAIAQALAWLRPDGALVDPAATTGGGKKKKVPIVKRWWFWTLVGAAVVGLSVTAAQNRQARQRLRVFVRP